MISEPLAPVSNFSATSQLSIEEFLKKVKYIKDLDDNDQFSNFRREDNWLA
jgi:hypothetical protein